MHELRSIAHIMDVSVLKMVNRNGYADSSISTILDTSGLYMVCDELMKVEGLLLYII